MEEEIPKDQPQKDSSEHHQASEDIAPAAELKQEKDRKTFFLTNLIRSKDHRRKGDPSYKLFMLN